VILCSKAGKEGITLHAARHLLFIERFFTSADEEQVEDRIRRIGQRHKTTIWYLHAPGTIDDRLDTIVRSKRALIRESLRSEDIAETTVSNVVTLVKRWDKFVARTGHLTDLGRGDPLPPLPSPSCTHAVVFYGERWTVRAAASWCRMHGYYPDRKVRLEDRFKLLVHPIEVFRPREFDVYRVCRDVRIITGKRLSQRNEKLMRARLNRLRE